MQPEKEVENSILEYLSLKRIFAFKIQNQGVFDPVRKQYRKSHNKHHRKGIPDILGIYRGLPLAIEVKSDVGRLSDFQKIFLQDFQNSGGIAFVARSVGDVIKHLGEADARMLPVADTRQTKTS